MHRLAAVTEKPSWRRVVQVVPILGWLPRYQRDWLRADLVAGVTLWGTGVPTALAYAQMAGLPPATGLYTAFVALFFYSVLASSRHQKVTTSSTMAVMSLAVVTPVALGDPAMFAVASSMLALIVGVMLLLAGVAKLGVIADFLSKPVVTGFVFGLAITIVISQSFKLFGIPNPGELVQQLLYLVTHLAETQPLTLLLGAGALVLIFWMRRVHPAIPGALVALVAGIAVVSVFNLDERGVAVVGAIPTGLPSLQVPFVSLDAFVTLMVGAMGIVFLAVGESIGTARAFASRYHYTIDADQELIAMGVANISTGLTQGFTADASLSTTATADAVGAKSQLSAIVAAALIMLTAAFLAGLFRNLPNAVLGAVVIASVIKLMDVPEMARYRREGRIDFYLALLAALGVILTTVLAGLLLAVFMSLVMIIYQTSRPHLNILGHASEGHVYGELDESTDYRPVDGLLVLAMDAPLYFYNANVVSAQVSRAVQKAEYAVRALVFDLRTSGRFDIASADMLVDLTESLQTQGVGIYLVVTNQGRERLHTAKLDNLIGVDHMAAGLHQAVQWAEAAVAASAAQLTPPADALAEPDAEQQLSSPMHESGTL